jgi:N-methylhydantoinase B
LETKAPWIIDNYYMRRDSGGPGQHRGGLGVTRTYRFLTDSSVLTLVKKTKTKPWGMAGGEDGENGHVIVWPGTDKEIVTGAIAFPMAAGDVIVNNSGGGGGWGNPLQRDPDQVLNDVRNGFISIESARNDYGVVIDPESLVVDTEATSALRQER